MSAVAPASGEMVEATPRRAMTPARKRRISERQHGICAYPQCEARIDEYDHIVCLELGGKDSDANTEGLCVPHHRLKTNRDLKLIAKARRIRKEIACEGRVKPALVSRGFGKSQSKTKWPSRPFPKRQRVKRVQDAVQGLRG